MSSVPKQRKRPSRPSVVELLLSPPVQVQQQTQSLDLTRYRDNPVGYCREVLGIEPTPDQCQILKSLLTSPYRVLVPSGHNTGKTHVAAAAISWWYDSRQVGAVFTLGPRHDSLKETVWAEVRMQRAMANVQVPDNWIGPSAPEMRSSPVHWAKALTAAKDASLTGRHLPNMLFIVEEAIGVDPIFWQVLQTMFDPSLGHAMLAIFNPTTTTSQAYIEDCKLDDPEGPDWHRIRLNALNHPNIASELAGQGKVVPHAVSVAMVDKWVRDWCEPLSESDVPQLTDLEWRPGSGRYVRPGPLMQARALGVWPDQGDGVWSEYLFLRCLDGQAPVPSVEELPEIGCDCAQGKGEDFHAIHARWGSCSLHHETSNTMDAVRIYGRLKAVAAMLAARVNERLPRGRVQIDPTQIPIKIDDDGTGNAIAALLQRDRYTVILISAARQANRPDLYPNRRSELWFECAERARTGGVYLGGLPKEHLRRLKQQLMAPAWDLDNRGRRVVERKEDTKEKIGRSPDDADAINLAYLSGYDIPPPEVQQADERGPRMPDGEAQKRRGLYGR